MYNAHLGTSVEVCIPKSNLETAQLYTYAFRGQTENLKNNTSARLRIY